MKNSLVIASWLGVLTALVAAGCSSSAPPPAKSETSRPPQAAAPPPAHESSSSAATALGRPLPPYHESAEAGRPFPPLMPASRYADYPVVARVYEIAHRIPEVLAQQPCFCYCDKFGHRSLLDCYASDHGAG